MQSPLGESSGVVFVRSDKCCGQGGDGDLKGQGGPRGSHARWDRDREPLLPGDTGQMQPCGWVSVTSRDPRGDSSMSRGPRVKVTHKCAGQP